MTFFSAIFLCARSRRDQSPRRELDGVGSGPSHHLQTSREDLTKDVDGDS
jgi:hypothetical protein